MLKKIHKFSLAIFLIAAPLISAAQLEGTSDFFEAAKDLVGDVLIPLAFLSALAFFFWGVAKYIWSEGQGKEDGKRIMIWGVIAIFVMSSIWGLVYFIRGELEIGNNSSMPIPSINTGGTGGTGGPYNI